MFKRQVTRVRARARLATRASLALLLTASTAWIGAYFWTHTTFAQATLTSALLRHFDHALVGVSAVGWGPSPLHWWARDVVIGETHTEPALSAELAYVEVDPKSLWSDEVRLAKANASAFGVHLRWGADGRSNLSRLRPAPEPEAAPRRARAWAIEETTLSEGEVTLTWPTWGLAFQSVDASGAISRNTLEGLIIEADLKGAEALFEFPSGPYRFDRHAIEGFTWRRGAFDVARISLEAGDKTEIDVTGNMGFRGGLSADLSGAVCLAPGVDAQPWSRWLPGGLSLERVRLTRRPTTPWGLVATGLSASELRLKAWRLQGLVGALEVDWASSGGVPSMALRSDGLAAEVLERGTTLSASNLSVEALDLKLGLSSEGRLKGLKIRSANYEQGRVGALALDASLIANIGGGSVEASLTSDSGDLTLSGPLEARLLSRRLEGQLALRFTQVREGLARWIKALMPEGERGLAPDALEGQAGVAVRLSAAAPLQWSWLSFDWEVASP